MSDVVEVINDRTVIDVIQNVATVIEVIEAGPQGPAGPVATPELISDLVTSALGDYFVLHPQSWTFNQNTAVFHWVILHPLGHRPDVTVTDSAGTEYIGDVSWPAPNIVTIDFNVPLAGTATLT